MVQVMYQNQIKRILDTTVAILLLVVAIPIFLLVAILLKSTERGEPVIFKQIRAGKNRQPFVLYKFRTMSKEAPDHMPTWALENAEVYITKIGKILRKTSLDELPQLYNILRGEMSFVGPRPVIFNETMLIHLRSEGGAYDVLPGITGLAQINGRDDIEVGQKARLDHMYSESVSFKTDALIALMTIPAVFMHDGVVEGKLLRASAQKNDLAAYMTPDELQFTMIEEPRSLVKR